MHPYIEYENYVFHKYDTGSQTSVQFNPVERISKTMDKIFVNHISVKFVKADTLTIQSTQSSHLLCRIC